MIPTPLRAKPNRATVLCNSLWVNCANTRVRNETHVTVQRSHALRVEGKWRRLQEAEAAKIL